MKKPSVFITRQINAQAIQELSQTCSVDVWMDSNPPPHPILVEKANQVEGLLTLLTDPVDARVISSPGLRIISQMAVGTDNIDLLAATQRGLPVGHTPGVLTETCADFTMALLLSVVRRVVEANNEVRQGIWRP